MANSGLTKAVWAYNYIKPFMLIFMCTNISKAFGALFIQPVDFTIRKLRYFYIFNILRPKHVSIEFTIQQLKELFKRTHLKLM